MPDYFIRYRQPYLRVAGTGEVATHFISLSAPSRVDAIEYARQRRGIRMEDIIDIVETPGRPPPRPEPERVGKIVVRINRVRLNRGGYDPKGRYWGAGEPLFMYYSDDAEIYGHIRASDRASAKEKVVKSLHSKGLRNGTFTVR